MKRLLGVLLCLVIVGPDSTLAAKAPVPAAAQPAVSTGAQTLFAQASPAVVKIRTYTKTNRPLATGSGFLVDGSGTIVTNHHVIEDAASARVYIQKKGWLPVTKVIGVRESRDLAIIRVDGKDLPSLKLKTTLPKVGEKVYAIGSPHGLTNTLSDGLVSGLRRQGLITLIQTSAPISHGSSGGPLLNSAGDVLGVTSSGIFKGENLGFAVPAIWVSRLIKKPVLPSQSTHTLLKPPSIKVDTAPKVYRSLQSLLSKVPRNLIPKNRLFTSLQFSLLNEWFAANAPPGTIQGLRGEFYSSSPDRGRKRIGIIFKSGHISLQQCKVSIHAIAYVPMRFAADVLRLKRGKTVILHGQIHTLNISCDGAIVRGTSKRPGTIRMSLSECAFGNAPLPPKNPSKPKPVSRPAKPKRTNEDKARSQLALARSYINAGLKAKANDTLKSLIAKYPKTQAATKAKTILKSLSKQ